MENTEFPFEAKQKTKASKPKPSRWKVITAALVAVVLLMGGVYYFVLHEAPDNEPPTLEPISQSTFQGFMGGEVAPGTTVMKFKSEDLTNWIANQTIWAAEGTNTYIDHVRLKEEYEDKDGTQTTHINSGAVYVHAKEDTDFLEIANNINPEVQGFLLAKWDEAEGGWILTDNSLYTAKKSITGANLEAQVIKKGQVFIIMTATDGQIRNVILDDASGEPSENYAFCEETEAGWINGAAKDLKAITDVCGDHIKAVWVETDWYASENKVIEKADGTAETVPSKYANYIEIPETDWDTFAFTNYHIWINFDTAPSVTPVTPPPAEPEEIVLGDCIVWTEDVPGTVTFTHSCFEDEAFSAGGALTFNWDFGDGNNDLQQNTVHEYAAADTYTVVFTITAAGVGKEFETSTEITVTDTTEPECGNYTLEGDEECDFETGCTECACDGETLSMAPDGTNACVETCPVDYTEVEGKCVPNSHVTLTTNADADIPDQVETGATDFTHLSCNLVADKEVNLIGFKITQSEGGYLDNYTKASVIMALPQADNPDTYTPLTKEVELVYGGPTITVTFDDSVTIPAVGTTGINVVVNIDDYAGVGISRLTIEPVIESNWTFDSGTPVEFTDESEDCTNSVEIIADTDTDPDTDDLFACFKANDSSAETLNITAGETVTFDPECSKGNIENFEWSYTDTIEEDNEEAEDKSVKTYTYNDIGSHTVALFVLSPEYTGPGDPDTLSYMTKTIVVEPTDP
jgi:hypothetical protein